MQIVTPFMCHSRNPDLLAHFLDFSIYICSLTETLATGGVMLCGDAFPLTVVIRSFRRLPVTSNHSPLTSLQFRSTQSVSTKELPLAGCFLFFTPFCINSRDSVKIPGDRPFQKQSNQHIWQQQTRHG